MNKETRNASDFFPKTFPDGRPLSIDDLVFARRVYEIGCIAEYLYENYKEVGYKWSFVLAEMVYDYKYKYNTTESDAITEIMWREVYSK